MLRFFVDETPHGWLNIHVISECACEAKGHSRWRKCYCALEPKRRPWTDGFPLTESNNNSRFAFVLDEPTQTMHVMTNKTPTGRRSFSKVVPEPATAAARCVQLSESLCDVLQRLTQPLSDSRVRQRRPMVRERILMQRYASCFKSTVTECDLLMAQPAATETQAAFREGEEGWKLSLLYGLSELEECRLLRPEIGDKSYLANPRRSGR